MKRTLLLSALVTGAFASFAQQEKSQGFSVGLNITPVYSRLIIASGGSGFVANELPYISLEGGVDVFYKINERFQLYSGVQHRQTGSNTKEFELYSIMYDPALPKKVAYQYRYQYIHVPLEMRVFISKGFYVQTGVGLNFLYSVFGKTIKTFHDGRVEISKTSEENVNYSDVVLSGNLQTGYTFNRAGKWNYSLAAYSSLGINCIVADAPFNRRFLMLGTSFQVRYSL